MKTTSPASSEPLMLAPNSDSESSATTESNTRFVIKRNGQQTAWDRSRIVRALTLVYTHTPATQSDASTPECIEKIARLAEGVEWAVWHRFPG